jgi:hypothetical protein
VIDTMVFGPATVVSDDWTVELPDGTRGRAQPAMAVGYEPAAGDRVLVIGSTPEELYAIGVLSGRGRVVLQAPEIEVRSDRFLQWVTGLYQLRSRRARVRAEESLDLRADRTYVEADAEVVVDARTIHLG